MEPSGQNRPETFNQDKENVKEFINENDSNSRNIDNDTIKRRNVPVSSLSDEEIQVDEVLNTKRIKTDTDTLSNTNKSLNKASNPEESKGETYTFPTIKIQPILGGKALSFPVHPRLSLIDLKDFILFSLNIPHPQQILSFFDESEKKLVLLSNFSENTLLCAIPGLIDEITGRCAPVGLSFKMSSGMDFSLNPSDFEYENESNNLSDTEGYFEINGGVTSTSNCGDIDNNEISKISSLASTLASIIPFPPGVPKTSKMLLRSLSKSSPTNNNLPTLWEIYFPESGVKMVVTALINVNEVKSDEEIEKKDIERDFETIQDGNKTSSKSETSPILVITPPEISEEIVKTNNDTNTVIVNESNNESKTDSSPKNNCEKCRVRCRPALRFICKCHKTFCQSHRYPDQHDCTYDHRADGIATIQANNPKIVKDKVGNF